MPVNIYMQSKDGSEGKDLCWFCLAYMVFDLYPIKRKNIDVFMPLHVMLLSIISVLLYVQMLSMADYG